MSILRNFLRGNPKKKTPSTRPKRRKRKIPVRRPSKIINDIERAIDKNGCCSIKLYKLYGHLGYKRRGASINVHNIQQQYSSDRTKDKLDIFGETGDKNVVVELKNKGGGKSAVEQVLRYAGMLKQESPEKEVRKILITGIRSLATAKAIHGMRPEEKEQFEWYLYKYDKTEETITFERISHQFLERHLGRKKHRLIRSN